MDDTNTAAALSNEATRRRLFQRFDALGIVVPIVPYPTHRTVEEGKVLRGAMAGTFTKNLLLKDKKGRLFLLTVDEDRALDLKILHLQIGAQSRLNFASGDLMMKLLGVTPGALTPLALINDTDGSVTVAIDMALLEAEQINVHPLVNTESTGLRPVDLLTFIRSCAREPILIRFDPLLT
jgi:Ala-tRNA(Pro) deacylase